MEVILRELFLCFLLISCWTFLIKGTRQPIIKSYCLIALPLLFVTVIFFLFLGYQPDLFAQGFSMKIILHAYLLLSILNTLLLYIFAITLIIRSGIFSIRFLRKYV